MSKIGNYLERNWYSDLPRKEVMALLRRTWKETKKGELARRRANRKRMRAENYRTLKSWRDFNWEPRIQAMLSGRHARRYYLNGGGRPKKGARA